MLRTKQAVTLTEWSDPRLLTPRQVRRVFSEHIAAARYFHVIKLDALETLDSRTLGAVIVALRTVREVGGNIQLVAAKPELRKILAVSGLDQVFSVHATEEDATAASEGCRDLHRRLAG